MVLWKVALPTIRFFGGNTMSAKMQHCFWCGAELGVYEGRWRELEACGERECQRELIAAYRAEEDERRFAAEQDHYERY